MDLADLYDLMDLTNNRHITLVAHHLAKESRNHLRAFLRALTAQGETNTPQYLDQATFDAILEADMERRICLTTLTANPWRHVVPELAVLESGVDPDPTVRTVRDQGPASVTDPDHRVPVNAMVPVRPAGATATVATDRTPVVNERRL